MRRSDFAWLVRDALTSLHDPTALEMHPLNSVVSKTPGEHEGQGAYLRNLLLSSMERLRPPGREPNWGATEWRPYLVLQGRYVEGISLQTLETQLALSGRQLSREHGRAIRALASLLQPEHTSTEPTAGAEGSESVTADEQDEFGDFEATRAALDLAEALSLLSPVFAKQAQAAGATLLLALPESLPTIQADRVILRQILLALLSCALRMRSTGDITVTAEAFPERVVVSIQFLATSQPPSLAPDDERTLAVAQYWAQRFGASIRVGSPNQQPGSTQLLLSWPRADQPTVLIVDDQESAIRLFQRYLSRTGLRVVGVSESERVLPSAREIQPRVITLDIMMPTTDGWELLLALKADPDTRHIPVVVCSVWNVPELASSYGAAGFLRKPITQKDLLGALGRLLTPDSAVGSSLANSPEPS